jgi:hypothetical protein
MKHSEWLRLKAKGDEIVASLRTQGYQCRKQTRSLSWHLCKGTISYNLTWLPAPVSEWSLLPNDATPERKQLLSEINSILKTDRGCDRLTQPCNKIEPVADTPSPAFSQRDRFWLQDNYPWIIVWLLPNAQHYVVGRFYSRTEAENHQRFLSRFMPAAEFEVTFEAPSAVATADAERDVSPII